MNNREITKLRQQLDDVDKQLSSLLAKRIELATRIVILKTQSGLAAEDIRREQQVLQQVFAAVPKQYHHTVNAVYRILFSAAKEHG